ncbi:sigma-70 family RNA polymerase sigma factor SigG [Plantactinospora mayteni]|uniref:ECF RNA polymerase sigma factor SigG n=1 Tax=Plantactinospora mayteni TaxID=566021 RepID=A0ABQ4EZ25_9ACTN|nr:sigma-70 family RNA polymerase sigma factor [Plantactinospora mayteni]GIG99910.1 ECF RNA polymerase sigma factor SigG [Plantactinospora mayteni]
MSDLSPARSTDTRSGSGTDSGSGDADLRDARDGDDAAFSRLVAPLRPELHAYCYQLLGSAHDADDAVQDALLRAWRGLAGFEGRGSLRSWLYTVATRTCLDIVRGRSRRALPVDLGPAGERVVLDSAAPSTEVGWLGPYPDADLAGGPASPHARYERREAVELAFVAALQHLPGNQRAVLLLFDVLGFSAAEIADLLGTSATSVNSALARARRLLAARLPATTQQRTLRLIGDDRVRKLAAGFADALERHDTDALIALLTEDVTWSMPPLPHWYAGLPAVAEFAREVPMGRCPSWRTRIVSANGQPAVACYVGPDAAAPHAAWSITVLTLRGDRIAGLISFLDAAHVTRFGLPAVLP